MGTVSVSLPSDGTTADVSDYNTPITTIVNAINGGLDNANIASSAAIDPSKIAGGSAAMLSAWTSWTPTFTNLTVGSGTLVAKYIQIGKTVHFIVKFTFGSGSSLSVGTDTVATLPVSANTGAYFQFAPLGNVTSYDLSATTPWFGVVGYYSATEMVFESYVTSAAIAKIEAINASQPMTWATGDILFAQGTYEAA